jgi:hypothetical protein
MLANSQQSALLLSASFINSNKTACCYSAVIIQPPQFLINYLLAIVQLNALLTELD